MKRKYIGINRNTILVKLEKGRKDRITILSKKVKNKLIDYLVNDDFKSKSLFEGRNKKKYFKS